MSEFKDILQREDKNDAYAKYFIKNVVNITIV